MDAPAITVRNAVRGVILSDHNEILLLKTWIPDNGLVIWITPGGGIDAGETALECLSRELWEELGYRGLMEPGNCIWHRRHTFLFNNTWFDQIEDFYLVRTPRFPVRLNNQVDEIEARSVQEHRWWKIEDIQSSTENFALGTLGTYLAKIALGQIPEAPIDVSR